MLTKNFIVKRLDELAEERGITVLYACESGSRAWGLASTDSDYDVRFVYRQPKEKYLQLEELKDQIGPLMERGGELDLVGWDITKFLYHLSKSNPGVLEWTTSSIIYSRDLGFVSEVRKLRDAYFNGRRGVNHYLGIGRSVTAAGRDENGSWKLKSYFYKMRSLLAAAWIAERNTPPPITFAELAVSIKDPTVKRALSEMRATKAAVKESYRTRVPAVLEAYFQILEETTNKKLTAMAKTSYPMDSVNRFYREIIGWA